MKTWQSVITDAWKNATTKLGTAYASLSYHSMASSVWLTITELDNLYVGDPIARRIILEPIDDAFKKGLILTRPADTEQDAGIDQEKVIRDKLKALDAVDKLKESLAWGSLYGRGALALGAYDGAEDLTEPLDLERVIKLKWLRVLKCECFAAGLLDNDLDSPGYGEPEYWQVSNTTVHTSRLILTGAVMTNRELREENAWRDIPVLQSVYRDLRNYDSAKTGMAQMLIDASQAVLKINDLPRVLADDDTVLKARLRILEMSRALHIMPINAGDSSGNGSEDFQYVERTFSGVADTFDRLLGSLSSSIGWPQTKLFGRSPAGENATGESDQAIWDDKVLAEQQGRYLAPLQQLVDFVVQVEGLSPGWTVSFAPLRQMTEGDKAELQSKIADTDIKYIGAGVYDELTVAMHRFGGEEPSFEPVMMSADDVEAARVLQEIDLSRAVEPDFAPTEVGEETAAGPAQDTALNGAQVDKAISIVEKVGERKLPRASGLAMLHSFYPLNVAAATEVMGPVGDTWFQKKEESDDKEEEDGASEG